MPLNIVLWGASELVSAKALLLKHYYRRQRNSQKLSLPFPENDFSEAA